MASVELGDGRHDVEALIRSNSKGQIPTDIGKSQVWDRNGLNHDTHTRSLTFLYPRV